jgi:hypothetical protein
VPVEGIRSLFASALVLATLAGLAPATAVDRDGTAHEIAVSSYPIPTFKVHSDETRFGPFEFLGGVELSSPDPEFGGLSALRLLEDGASFIGTLDTGFWITGKIERDGDGRLAGVSDVVMAAMRGPDGAVVKSRYDVDAEGLAIDGDRVLVSFEREHRIEIFALSGIPTGAPISELPHPIPDYEFRSNRGMEAIAIAPKGTALDGAVIVVSEKSLNKNGDLFAGIVTGPGKGVFFVRRHAPFDVTDGDFLPNGDLLLLERRFSIAGGVGMRIRRILGSDIRAGKTVDGDILLEADFSYQIDNMESLDITTAADGSTRVLLVSDDNHSLLQRTLMLEFRLHE